MTVTVRGIMAVLLGGMPLAGMTMVATEKKSNDLEGVGKLTVTWMITTPRTEAVVMTMAVMIMDAMIGIEVAMTETIVGQDMVARMTMMVVTVKMNMPEFGLSKNVVTVIVMTTQGAVEIRGTTMSVEAVTALVVVGMTIAGVMTDTIAKENMIGTLVTTIEAETMTVAIGTVA
jgi:hypothetical protein